MPTTCSQNRPHVPFVKSPGNPGKSANNTCVCVFCMADNQGDSGSKNQEVKTILHVIFLHHGD